jgi:hypothetical protein
VELIQGVIEKILWKDAGTPDQFGNTHRLSIKVGDSWIGFGKKKANSRGEFKVSIKKGAGWEDVCEGDEIALVTTESNGYLNGKTNDIKIVKKGNASSSGGPAPTSSKSDSSRGAPVAKPAPASNGVDWAAKDAGAAASASIDKALKYIELRKGEVKTDYATVLSIARDMQGLVKTLAAEILNPPATLGDSDSGSPSGSPRGPLTSGMPGKTIQNRTTKTKPAPVEPDESDFEDSDIPF